MQIEISEENYKFLTEFMTEYNSQDNRATSLPIMYQIRVKQRVGVYPGCEDEELFFYHDRNDFEGNYENIDELRFYLSERYPDENYSNKELYPEEKIDEIAEKKENIIKIYYLEIDEIKQVFFTKKALDIHIEANKHHYLDKDKPFDYVDYCWRNPEIENLFIALEDITKIKLEKFYHK